MLSGSIKKTISSRQLWAFDPRGTDFLPVKASQKCHQLRMIQPHARRRYSRPAKAGFFKGFRIKAYPGAIPPHDFQPIRPLRSEYMKRTGERIETAVPYKRHQGGCALAKVDWLSRHVNHNTRRDHACRTARMIPANCRGSILLPTRITTSPTTISTAVLFTASKRVNFTGASFSSVDGAIIPDESAFRRQANTCEGSRS
ncbi:Uncharacterised protein [Brucella anthropi]|nr:Uncharacterised protein [Brucella anthropi]